MQHSGAINGQVKAWKIAQGATDPPTELDPHGDRVTCLAFDGDTIISAGADKVGSTLVMRGPIDMQLLF
jgi:WD40 repeat protein